MSAKLFFVSLALSFSIAVPSFAAPLKVERRQIIDKKAAYSIEVAYPRTGRTAIDRMIEDWAKGNARDFVSGDDSDANDSPQPWSLEIGYDVVRNDDAMFGVIFSQYSYTGGAHGNTNIQTFNIQRSDETALEIAELFSPRGIARISDIAIAAFKKSLTGPNGMSDLDWVKRGAGPNPRNFSAFILRPKTLSLYFNPYQVAAYAAGPQELHIPLSRLRDAMRPDPRAPAASFDCVLARSDAEQAICSSRDLARLDRRVAEAYADKLTWAENDAKRATARQAQRAWLKVRDASCLRVGQALVSCLMSVYQQRLKALNSGA